MAGTSRVEKAPMRSQILHRSMAPSSTGRRRETCAWTGSTAEDTGTRKVTLAVQRIGYHIAKRSAMLFGGAGRRLSTPHGRLATTLEERGFGYMRPSQGQRADRWCLVVSGPAGAHNHPITPGLCRCGHEYEAAPAQLHRLACPNGRQSGSDQPS